MFGVSCVGGGCSSRFEAGTRFRFQKYEVFTILSKMLWQAVRAFAVPKAENACYYRSTRRLRFQPYDGYGASRCMSDGSSRSGSRRNKRFLKVPN